MRRKAWAWYVALGVVLYLVFLVATLPADRAYAWMKHKLSDVSLFNVSGSVWSGQASAAQFGAKLFQSVTWNVRPWGLLLGTLNIAWSFDNGDANGRGVTGISPGGNVKFKDVTGLLPIKELRPWLVRIPVPLEGMVVLELDEVVANLKTKRATEANGKLVWKEASIAVGSGVPLGNFQMVLDTDDNGIKGIVKDLGGPIQAQATLLMKNDTLQLSGTLVSRDTRRTDITQGLSFLGRPGPDGRFNFNYKGNL